MGLHGYSTLHQTVISRMLLTGVQDRVLAAEGFPVFLTLKMAFPHILILFTFLCMLQNPLRCLKNAPDNNPTV